MLEARNLHKIYQTPSGEVVALRDFTFDFRPGCFYAIMGPSGSGKSSLLHLLASIDTPTCGEVRLGGQAISQLTESARAGIRLRRFGFVFQAFNLVTVLTAEQNISFPMGLTGMPVNERKMKTDLLLKRFGLRHRRHHLPLKLSGGERQRVALARALANDPDIVFADEPTGNLDTANGATVLAALREVTNEGRSVIVVTHDLGIAERSDIVLKLRDGQLVPE
ncbi:MAG: ABC transporter ATP-binding protein [Trueperaceae bacterium]|nr:MAG: ABC transporter ATP-binding protein [Trueperaceae bacterium]